MRIIGTGGAAIALAALLGGCLSRAPWGVDTLCIVEDIDAATEERLIRALSQDPKCYGFEVVTSQADGGRLQFLLTGVDDLATLRDVQATIRNVSHDSRVPVVLQHTAITFASVSGRGNAEIHVVGTATPGAHVILDIGATTVTTPVDADGRWTAGIDKSGDLTDRGGWIYGLIQKGNARQFIRMNVLDTDGCERIREADLPDDSLLHSR